MIDQNVPYAAIEVLSARYDRGMRRVCAAFIVAIIMVCITVTSVCAFMCRSITNTSNNNTNMIIQQMKEYYNGENGN